MTGFALEIQGFTPAVWVAIFSFAISVIVAAVLIWQTRIMAATAKTTEESLRLQAMTSVMGRIMDVDVAYTKNPGSVREVLPAYTALRVKDNDPVKTDFVLLLLNLCDLIFSLREKKYMTDAEWIAWQAYFRSGFKPEYCQAVCREAFRLGWYADPFKRMVASELLAAEGSLEPTGSSAT